MAATPHVTMTAPGPSRRLTRRIVILLPVWLPFVVLFGTGLYGLDFGFHWDERLLLNLLDWSVANGLLLPKDFYNYPSMSYWLTLGAIGPELLLRDLGPQLSAGAGAIARDETTGLRDQLRQTIATGEFHLMARAVFLFVSSLSLIPVYLAPLVWRRSWIEAFLATAIVGTSWELAYHFRWMAPDGILVTFAASCLLFTLVYHTRSADRRWLWLAAAAAGLACGTKYPAGMLLVPVWLAAFFSRERRLNGEGLLALLAKTSFVFGAAYLITTPGTLLQPEAFIQDVLFEVRHYQAGHHGYSVAAGLEHGRLMLSYLALVFLSPLAPLALALFACFLIGCWTVARASWPTALVLLSFPALHLLTLSLQRVMIVRNLLVLAPFIAVLAARGVATLWELAPGRIYRTAVGLTVAALLLTNAAWLAAASETIHNRSRLRFVREAAAYVAEHPDTVFFASEQVWRELEALTGRPPNLTRDPGRADQVLLYSSEGLSSVDWPTNQRRLTVTWFGPREVNFNYYAGWEGDDRILLMTMEQARSAGVRPLTATAPP